jgi:uncharacterized membrane protein
MNQDKNKALRPIQIVAGGMLITIIVLILIPTLGLITPQSHGEPMSDDILIILVAIGILLPAIAPLAQKLVVKGSSTAVNPMVVFMQSIILRYSVNEAGAVLGFVASVVGHSPYPVIVCGLWALICGAAGFPRNLPESITLQK